MDWFSGDVAQCIKKVKSEKKIFLVFSRNDEIDSQHISEVLDSDAIVGQCENIICLQLQHGSIPFNQFCAVYKVSSVPCIHLISPSGEVLSIKSADFSQEGISLWLQEIISNFDKFEKKEVGGSSAETQMKSDAQLASESIALCTEVDVNRKSEEGTTSPSCPTQSRSESVPRESGNEANSSIPVESSAGSSRSQSEDGEKEQQAEEVSTNASLDEKIEYARRLLEERRQEKAVKAFQEVHEAELKRRNLGRNLGEFKRLKQEQEIRERLEEQKREKAEREETRRRILAQIELDRRDRMAASAQNTTVSNSQTLSKTSVPLNSDEVRLQIRLPDGAHMIGIFSAEAYLGTNVRQYIAARVQGTGITSESGAIVAPLSDAMRSSFAPVVSSGYTFRQMRPNPPRHFTSDDESTKTLRDLGLWPSAVLTLYTGSTSCSNTSGSGAGSVTEYSQNVLSYLFGLVWIGIRGAGETVYYLGDSLIHLGQSVWQTLFGGVGGGGRTVGRAPGSAAVPTPDSHQPRGRSNDEDSDGRSAYRRQCKISRLSHMPDDTDEQARWNGNSTTQL
ncbi:hypothetical protein Aperf_G00000033138 [Anoplocephala perfoliata]